MKAAVEQTPAPVRCPSRRCAIYTRKSTAKGLEQNLNSLDAQRGACEAYIAARVGDGWQPVEHAYDDGGFTGATLERPAFQQLLQDIDAGEIDVVVVYKVDRLSRSLLDFAKVMDRFQRAGVAFVSVTQNFSTADAMGRLTLNMLMSFAEFEREMIAERTRDKMAAARRQGHWTGGPVPLGYDVIDKELVVNEAEAVVVRELFDLYVDLGSALTVARELNRRGRKTKYRRAANGNVRAAKPWNKASVLRVLRNPVYAGWMPYGDERHEGRHEAIVDRGRFLHAEELLNRQTRRRAGHGRPLNPEYLLQGLLRCRACGGAMTPGSTRKGGRVYRYYRCVTRDKHGADGCRGCNVPAHAIEEFVVERIREAVSEGAAVAKVTAALAGRIESRRTELQKELGALPGQIGRLAADVEGLTEAMAAASERVRERLAAQLEKASAALEWAQARQSEVARELSALERAEAEAGWVGETLAQFGELWDVMTPLNRRRLVAALVHEVGIDDEHGTVDVVLAHVVGEG